jgi:hypothetical protein
LPLPASTSVCSRSPKPGESLGFARHLIRIPLCSIGVARVGCGRRGPWPLDLGGQLRAPPSVAHQTTQNACVLPRPLLTQTSEIGATPDHAKRRVVASRVSRCWATGSAITARTRCRRTGSVMACRHGIARSGIARSGNGLGTSMSVNHLTDASPTTREPRGAADSRAGGARAELSIA